MYPADIPGSVTTAEGTPVGIRRAERADLLAVMRIERASFTQPWPYDAFERFLDRPGFLVAVEPPDAGGGEGADTAGVDRDDDGTASAAPGDGDVSGSPGSDVSGDLEPDDVGSVVGFVVADLVRSHGRNLGHIKDLAVHPERRGRGIGSQLLEAGLAVLSPADTVKLEVRDHNDAARALYRRYGFEALRRVEGYYDDGDDAIVMVRDHG